MGSITPFVGRECTRRWLTIRHSPSSLVGDRLSPRRYSPLTVSDRRLTRYTLVTLASTLLVVQSARAKRPTMTAAQ